MLQLAVQVQFIRMDLYDDDDDDDDDMMVHMKIADPGSRKT